MKPNRGSEAAISLPVAALLGCAALIIIAVLIGLLVLIGQVIGGRMAPTGIAVLPSETAFPTTAFILPTLTALPSETPMLSTPTAFLANDAPTGSAPTVPPPPTLRPTDAPRPTIGPAVEVTRPGPTTPAVLLIPDSELVNSPGVRGFDLLGFITMQPGLIRFYEETVSGRVMTAGEMIEFVSASTSVNPRLLLALLEYRGGWLSLPEPAAREYPLGHADPAYGGLFRQLIWTANTLNEAYCGYRTRGVIRLNLPGSGETRYYAPGLNAGSIALQAFLAATATDAAMWERDISPDGFSAVYRRLFGDPFAYAVSLVPPDLQQPPLSLPFAAGERWFFSGGPHGGWDRRGSAWAAIDLAPPRPPDAVFAAEGKCHVSPYFARAMAAGVIARARDGAVVLDLDMDGDERTGWTILYLHIARRDRAEVGRLVAAGDPVGRPSCEGFYLNSPGTHIHIARRYNGEWITADCRACLPEVAAPPLVMSGWRARAEGRQVSMGWLERLPDAPYVDGVGLRIALGDVVTW